MPSLTLPLVHFWKVRTISWDHSYSSIFAYDRISPLYNMLCIWRRCLLLLLLITALSALSKHRVPCACLCACSIMSGSATPRTVAHGVTPVSTRLLPVPGNETDSVGSVGLMGLPRWRKWWRTLLPCRRHQRHGFDPWMGKESWRRAWHPSAVFLPGESHGQGSLVGCNPEGHKGLDTTEAT